MCDTIVALGSATEEGFTLFGKNSDREPDEVQNILVVSRKKHDLNETVQCTYLTIPQISETARVLLCQPYLPEKSRIKGEEIISSIENSLSTLNQKQINEYFLRARALVKNWGSKLDHFPSVNLGWGFSHYWRGYNTRNGII